MEKYIKRKTLFIGRAFNRLLNMDVKALFDNEHENAFQIYIINETNKDYTDIEFKASSPEFEIFQLDKSNKWVYNILLQTFAGDFWTPPDWDYKESKEEYEAVEDALLGLIQDNINEMWNNMLMGEEEAKYHEEYLEENKN